MFVVITTNPDHYPTKMSFPISLPRKALCFVLFCVSSYFCGAEDMPRMEPVITSDGFVVLHIFEIDDDIAPSSIREYSVLVSEDLENWEVLSRSQLRANLEVVDYEGQGRPVRFYRIVGLEVSDVVRLFSEGMKAELSELTEYASGIVVDGVTLEEYRLLQSRVSEIRSEILEFLARGELVPEDLLHRFRDSLVGIDRILVTSPLRLENEGVVYEVETSKAMGVFNDVYRRLGTVSLGDYDRIPGVDTVDLEGLDRLRNYLEIRRPGLESSLPVFDGFSPYGNFELLNRLVLKHIDDLSEVTTDLDSDGALEIDYVRFREVLNGSLDLQRAAESIIEAVEMKYAIEYSSVFRGPLSTADFKILLRDMDGLFVAMQQDLRAYVEGKEYDPVFEEHLLSAAASLGRTALAVHIDQFDSVLRYSYLEVEVFERFNSPSLSSPPRVSELKRLYSDLVAWRRDLIESWLSLKSELNLSAPFAREVEYLLGPLMNGEYLLKTSGLYGSAWNELDAALEEGKVVFEVEGLGDVLLEYPNIGALFPRSFAGLLENPIIEGVVKEDVWDRLLDRGEWYANSIVIFGSNQYSLGGYVVEYSILSEILVVLLDEYGEFLVRDGRVDEVQLGLLLLGEKGDDIVATTALARMSELHVELLALGLDGGRTYSWETYERIQSILTESAEILDSVQDDQNFGWWDKEDLLSNVLLASRQRILDELGDSLPESDKDLWRFSVDIEIEGVQTSLGLHSLKDAFEGAVSRVAVGYPFSSEQMARLNGVDQGELDALLSRAKFESIIGSTRIPYYFSEKARPSDFFLYSVYVPQLIESFDQEDVVAFGRLDREKLEGVLLAGLEPLAPYGWPLRRVHAELVESICQPAYEKLIELDFREWKSWTAAEAILADVHRQLFEKTAPFLDTLNGTEIRDLEYDTRYRAYWNVTNWGRVWRYVDDAKSNVDGVWVEVGSGERLYVDLDLSKGFEIRPWEVARDSQTETFLDRFVNLELSDILDATGLSLRIDFERTDGAQYDVSLSQNLDERALAVVVSRRLYQEKDTLPGLIGSDLFKDDAVVAEVFRRWAEGIDQKHHQFVKESRSTISDSMEKMRAKLVRPMTLGSIEALRSDVAELKATLKIRLMDTSFARYSSDLVELEEAVSLEFRNAYALLLSYVNDNDLYMETEYGLIRVPFHSLSRRVLQELEMRFPGESIASYHFASFYGVSVSDLREYHTLEESLDEQNLFAQSRSGTVEVVSRLSDIGMRQFVVGLIDRYLGEAYDPQVGSVSEETLMQMASQEKQGVERAIALLDKLFEESELSFEGIEAPASLGGLESATGAFWSWRLKVSSELSDDISALSPGGLAQVQQEVLDRDEKLHAWLDRKIFGTSIQILTVDGSDLFVDFSEYEERIEMRVEALVEGFDWESIAVRNEAFLEEREYFWNGDFSNIDWGRERPSRLGFYLVLARLVANYGTTVFHEGGFDVELFLAQLEIPHLDRASRLIEELDAEAERSLVEEELLVRDVIEDDGFARLKSLMLTFHVLYEKQMSLLGSFDRSSASGYFVEKKILDSWAQRIDEYETMLRGAQLRIGDEASGRVVDVDTVHALMLDLYEGGDVEFLDSYAVGGEMSWTYDRLRRVNGLGYSYFDDEYLEKSTDDSGWMYSFTNDELSELAGVDFRVVEGIDLDDPDLLTLYQIEASELIKGQLNLASLSPGLGFVAMGSGLRAYAEWTLFPGEPIGPIDWEPRFHDLSWRDQRFRVIQEVFEDHDAILYTDDGTFRSDRLIQLIQGKLVSD